MQEDDTSNKMFRVVEVDNTNPPEGITGDNWFRYVIGQGHSRIEGKKPGTLQSVTEHAESVVEDLNSRKGKGVSTYSTRKKV